MKHPLFTMQFQIEGRDCVRVYSIYKGGMLRFFKSDIHKIWPLFFAKGIYHPCKLKQIIQDAIQYIKEDMNNIINIIIKYVLNEFPNEYIHLKDILFQRWMTMTLSKEYIQ